MSLHFENVRLPLSEFDLELDLALARPVTGVFGPSGSGKTSLLEIVAGLRRPAQGAVRLDDDRLSDATARVWRTPESRAIGYVPQDAALFPHLTVRGNLGYGRSRARGGAGAGPSEGATWETVLGVLELTKLLDRPVGSLSGGEAHRVALGRALLREPRLLLLDEPLAGLELELKDRLLAYLRQVQTVFRRPTLYVSHAPEEMVALCDEVVVLRRGRVYHRGAPAELFERGTVPQYRLRPLG